MNERERGLIIFLGVVLVGLAGWYGYGWYSEWVEAREDEILALQDDLNERELAERRAERAAAQLVSWQERSLPADLELAASLYRNWLTQQVEAADWDRPTVDVGRASMKNRQTSTGEREIVYHLLPFSVRGRGSLADAVTFLYRFYASPHLHQIRRLSIKPTEEPGTFDLQVSIEAMSMPTANAIDQLSTVSYQRLRADDESTYREAILGRSPFSEYVPPRPPPPPRRDPPRQETPRPTPPPPPVFDVAKHAVITGITERGSEAEVWVNERTSGKLHKFTVGDSVRIGQFRGTIRRIGTLGVLIDLNDGGQCLLNVGQTLSEGTDLPPS